MGLTAVITASHQLASIGMVRALNYWLNELFRRHHRDVVRFATHLVGDRESGEDVVQDAYLRLATRNGGPIEHPKAYLWTTTRNAAIDFTVRTQREWAHRVDLENLPEGEAAIDPRHSYEARRQLAALAVLLNELPSTCRQAFVMNKLQGYTHPEIGRMLGISVSMVEKHVVRALLHCRDMMAREIDS